jgi:hypothetical protein
MNSKYWNVLILILILSNLPNKPLFCTFRRCPSKYILEYLTKNNAKKKIKWFHIQMLSRA